MKFEKENELAQLKKDVSKLTFGFPEPGKKADVVYFASTTVPGTENRVAVSGYDGPVSVRNLFYLDRNSDKPAYPVTVEKDIYLPSFSYAGLTVDQRIVFMAGVQKPHQNVSENSIYIVKAQDIKSGNCMGKEPEPSAGTEGNSRAKTQE